MELHAVFETWHLGDGNYPPLEKGMLVNLSFEVQPKRLERGYKGQQCAFVHAGDAEYDFQGEVVRVYPDDASPLIVVACGEFRFYIKSPKNRAFVRGDGIKGQGTLVLDHYIWVEFLDSYADPPDLFYNLRVEAIKKVMLPKHFIKRSGGTTSYPTRVTPSDYAPEDTSPVDRIRDEPFCHYVVRFTDENLPGTPIARTFR